MQSRIYILTLLGCLFLASCRDYVEVEQYNNRVFKYTNDYQLLLNNRSLFEETYILPLFSSDDVNADNNNSVLSLLTNGWDKVYTWDEVYYTDSQGDVGWDNLYKQIYTCNEIMAHVMDSENGTETQKRSVYAEAQFQRAYAYLTLVNLYSPVYETTTASTDPGVPLLLSPDLFQPLNRASVQKVYDQIIADLTAAEAYIPKYAATKLHPGQAALYATLARVYLSMRNYQMAGEYARKSLAVQSALIDLQPVDEGIATLPLMYDNPELILAKNTYINITVPLSTGLLSLLDSTDLRFRVYTRSGSSFYPSFSGRGYYRNRLTYENITLGPSVPEMMLISAEAYARNNQIEEALTTVNILREKRFQTEDYQLLKVASPQEALKAVLDERRRELMGTGLRWFDQRRFTKEPERAVRVNRNFKGVNHVLEPSSNRYIYPIGEKYLELNPEIGQSPR